nr:ABC transporter substrate-binding protein [Pseudomonas sp.]
ALSPSYKPMSEATLDYMLGKKKYERIGVLYQDDDYGREALEGVEAYLKSKDIKLVEKTSYKRGATDFASQMAKLKAANADLVFNASTLREYVGSVNEANKIGFKPDFVGTAANYSQQVPLLGGAGMEGVYAATFITLPSTQSENPAVRQWSEEYQKRFNEEPGLYSMYAYYALSTFAKIAERAGQDLTPESFNAAMEATDLPVDELGNPPFDVSPDDRLSNEKIRITQIQNGRWTTISDFIASPL